MRFRAKMFAGAMTLAAGLAGVGLTGAAGSAGAAGTAGPCGTSGVLSTASAAQTCSYTTAGSDTFTVPAGVTSVSVTAIGGAGRAGGTYVASSGGGGGNGASVVSPAVTVTPSDVLGIVVGADGATPTCPDPTTAALGGGGVGGSSDCPDGAGGGGGGASGLETGTVSPADPVLDDGDLVVAGGGGGGGGAGGAAESDGGSAGDTTVTGAGDGGALDCETGQAGAGTDGGFGPGDGSGAAATGCSSEDLPGDAGASGTGGAGADDPAGAGPGGGGGGYGGGGGGSAGIGTNALRVDSGGGAGSSYVAAGVTYTMAPSTAAPEVVISWTATAPTATITTPANGTTYTEGQAVSSSFTCADGAGGPGISSCTDASNDGSGATVSTATPGTHTYTVTATSADGLTGTASVTYTVIAPPTAKITTPASGATYAVNQFAKSAFSCAEASGGPGLASCDDGAGNTTGDPIDTSSVGTHSFTVTATSTDGLTSTTTVDYTVTSTEPTTSTKTPAPTIHPTTGGTANTTPTPGGSTGSKKTKRGAKGGTKPGTGGHRTKTVAPRLSRIAISAHTVRWCRGCRYPAVRLSFRLTRRATVRLALQARVRGHLTQLKTVKLAGHAGVNRHRLAGRWAGQLVPPRTVRLLVQLKRDGRWRTSRRFTITVRSRLTHPQ